jgi:hypothetical protein
MTNVGVPFFINGARFHGTPDLETLAAAISAAASLR